MGEAEVTAANSASIRFSTLKNAIKAAVSITEICLGVFIETLLIRRWPRAVHLQLSKQIIFSGVNSLPYIVVLAGIIGATLLWQGEYWLGFIGKPDLLTQFLRPGRLPGKPPALETG